MSSLNPIAAFQATVVAAHSSNAVRATASVSDGDGDHGVEPATPAPAASPSPGQPGSIINTQA